MCNPLRTIAQVINAKCAWLRFKQPILSAHEYSVVPVLDNNGYEIFIFLPQQIHPFQLLLKWTPVHLSKYKNLSAKLHSAKAPASKAYVLNIRIIYAKYTIRALERRIWSRIFKT